MYNIQNNTETETHPFSFTNWGSFITWGIEELLGFQPHSFGGSLPEAVIHMLWGGSFPFQCCSMFYASSLTIANLQIHWPLNYN